MMREWSVLSGFSAVLCLLSSVAVAQQVPPLPAPPTPVSAAPMTFSFPVAVVNIPFLMENAPQSQEAQRSLKFRFAKIEADLEQERLSIQVFKDSLNAELETLSEEARLQAERDFRSRNRNYQRQLEDFREELRTVRDQETRDVQKSVFQAIERVRELENIAVVLKEKDYIAASPEVNITDRVLRYLQQQFEQNNPAAVTDGTDNDGE